jgi:hypothetical protein
MNSQTSIDIYPDSSPFSVKGHYHLPKNAILATYHHSALIQLNILLSIVVLLISVRLFVYIIWLLNGLISVRNQNQQPNQKKPPASVITTS